MDINLITGDVGGIGKTLLTLFLTIHYCGNQRLVVADFDFRRPRLRKLFSKMGDTESLEDGLVVKSIDRNTLFVCRQEENATDIPDGIDGFLDKGPYALLNLASVVKLNPTVIIVDSGLPLASFRRPSQSARAAGTPSPKPPPNGTQIKVWHVWQLSQLMNQETMDVIKKRLVDIEYLQLGEFDEVENMYHVLNLFSLLNDLPNWMGVRAALRLPVDDPMYRLAYRMRPTAPVGPVIWDKVYRDLKPHLSSGTVLHTTEIIDKLVAIITGDRSKLRPRNIIGLPHMRQLEGYIEKLSLSNIPGTIEDLRYDLNSGYEIFRQQFGN